MKKRYAYAGASGRGLSYARPMAKDYTDVAEMVGVYDTNVGRARMFAEESDPNMPVYEDFDTMIREAKPDCVIVTCVDAYHSDYIIRALELGCDVITEKPMTTDDEKCRAILAAEKKYGKKVTVTFNMRYHYFGNAIKALMMKETIGKIYSVHFEWLLKGQGDHGTSYFHRWNARMNKSGGLLVHKSTHHFDLVNWFIMQKPVNVAAFGELNAYGAANALYADHGDRCSECKYYGECPYGRVQEGFDYKFYNENEKYETVPNKKDGCVFDEDIDIYDTMSVNVQYDGGAMLSYSLNAHAMYEGWRIMINGSEGRLEAVEYMNGLESNTPYSEIKVYDTKGNVSVHKISKILTGHGGGDHMLHEMLFRENVPDPMGCQAGTAGGTDSIMIGIAANKSIKEGRMINIPELLQEQ